jgi:tRNA (Thr-GGU) A37 N-methylase
LFTWIDRADRNVLQVHPRDDRTKPLHGVFSTRSPHRPNPIGLHRVTVVAIIDPLRFQVRNLEALDQTPIIDAKATLEGVAE